MKRIWIFAPALVLAAIILIFGFRPTSADLQSKRADVVKNLASVEAMIEKTESMRTDIASNNASEEEIKQATSMLLEMQGERSRLKRELVDIDSQLKAMANN